MATSVTVFVPYTTNLGKNSRLKVAPSGKRLYVPEDVKKAKADLEWRIRQAGGTWHEGRVRMSLYVEKPDKRADAINFVDVIADAASKAIGVDDRWFEIGGVEWDLVSSTRNPQIKITLEQDVAEDHKHCGDCKRELPVAQHFQRSHKRNKLGYQDRCRACHRLRTSLKRIVDDLEARGYVVVGNFELENVIDLLAFKKDERLFVHNGSYVLPSLEQRMELVDLAHDCGAVAVLVTRGLKMEVLSGKLAA